MLADVISFTSKDYQEIRRNAVKFCYQQEIAQEHAFTDDLLERFISHFNIPKEHQNFFKSFVTQIFARMPECDKLIEQYAKNWKLYRIAKVDLSILRVAIAELFERQSTNPAIIISDALSIADDFASKDSVKFINGILDSVLKNIKATPSSEK